MTIRGTAVDDLLAYVFDRQPHALRGPLAEWMTSSRRFAQFVETYRDKIRKKLRGAPEREALRDVQAELEAAYWLLQEPRFEVEYEKYGVGKARCPDFTVTYRTNTVQAASAAQREARRLTELVCAKLGQMQPGVMNLLWIVADGLVVDELDVGEVLKALKVRAEGKDSSLFARHGFRDAPDFFKYYRRLSGIVLRPSGTDARQRPTLWLNNQTQHPIPAVIRAHIPLSL